MDSDEAEETRREVEHELGVADDTRWRFIQKIKILIVNFRDPDSGE